MIQWEAKILESMEDMERDLAETDAGLEAKLQRMHKGSNAMINRASMSSSQRSADKKKVKGKAAAACFNAMSLCRGTEEEKKKAGEEAWNKVMRDNGYMLNESEDIPTLPNPRHGITPQRAGMLASMPSNSPWGRFAVALAQILAQGHDRAEIEQALEAAEAKAKVTLTIGPDTGVEGIAESSHFDQDVNTTPPELNPRQEAETAQNTGSQIGEIASKKSPEFQKRLRAGLVKTFEGDVDGRENALKAFDSQIASSATQPEPITISAADWEVSDDDYKPPVMDERDIEANRIEQERGEFESEKLATIAAEK